MSSSNQQSIGFCHGCTNNFIDPYTCENIEIFHKTGCQAIEVNLHSVDEVSRTREIVPCLRSFKHISLHAPCYHQYIEDTESYNLLRRISAYYHMLDAKHVVVHPDLIMQVELFRHFPDINWAIENMDSRKSSYKNTSDLSLFFYLNPHFKFVLDLGHCLDNDPSLENARNMITLFKDRIVEIHLSGYQKFHEPLFRTKQTEVFRLCRELEVPIIIESTFNKEDGPLDVLSEYQYVVKALGV